MDPNPAFEQRACKSCKASLDRFAEFSCKVELHQKKLQKLPEIIVVKIDAEENEFNEEKSEVKENELEPEQQFEVVELKPFGSTQPEFENENLEPEAKKPKPNEVEEPTLLEEASSDDEVICISDNEDTPKLRRSRRKSIHEKAAQLPEPVVRKARLRGPKRRERICRNFGEVLEKAESLFKTLESNRCEQIEIPKTTLKKDGEVPRSWLSGFENFKTWEDFTYVCKYHCNLKFEGLLAYSSHQDELAREDRSIQCLHCPTQFRNNRFLCSYINHVSSKHFQHLKFCCIVCSRVFYNMLSLVQHCKKQHGDLKLYDLYPCMECGVYNFNYYDIKNHKATHDK